MISYRFPSVFERHNSELDTVAKDLLNGLKIFLNGESYIIGQLALSEGEFPHKSINSSPEDLDYNLFLYAGLLLSNYTNIHNSVFITTGFPFSTYNINKNIAKTMINGKHIIDFDASTFSDKSKMTINVEVGNVEILTEMMGNIIALRKGEKKETSDFFIVSLGYGTCEAVFSTTNGIVQRTSVSTKGIVFAINMFMKELEKTHYLGLKNKRQIDEAFQEDYIVLNRKRFDIRQLKESVLKSYYEDVISPALIAAFTDTDFGKAKKMYITGGGALYPDLVNCFNEEFDDIINVEVVDNPLTLSSQGYYINSAEKSIDGQFPIGLDIGNSNTVLTQFEDIFYYGNTMQD